MPDIAAIPPSSQGRWRSWLGLCPALCALCHSACHAAVCGDCLLRHGQPAPRCLGCALRVPAGVARCGACLHHDHALDLSMAGVDYGFPWDGLLQAFKFGGRPELAELLLDRLDAALDAAHPPAPDWLLPVPLALQRLRERGYNQSWELARRLARRRGLRCDAGLLLRTRDTPHQIALPAEQRASNMRGAFAVEPLRLAELRGRSVALVDDVMTTGATLRELARVLKVAGAVHVQAWTIARTPLNP
nr:phosphoribosyltransferase family protein [uncultured Roseateles sp.]